MSDKKIRFIWVLVLLVVSCGQTSNQINSEAKFTLLTSTTTTSTTTTSTTTTSTTTTTLPTFYRLELNVIPEDSKVTLETPSEVVTDVEIPLDTYVSSPVRISIEAEGFNPFDQIISFDSDQNLIFYLDKENQLLHKIAEWKSGGAPKQVAFTPNGSELWVTQLVGDGVEIFKPQTGELLGFVDLPDGGSVEIIFNKAGTLAYVSQMETASVYEIDVSTREIIRNLQTEGNWSKVMTLSPDEKTLWVSNWSSNDVSEIDLDTGEVTARMSSVVTPRGLWVTPDGSKLYVAGFENGDIEVFNLSSRESTVIHRTGGAMRHLVGDPQTGILYASELGRDYILSVDTATEEVEIFAEVDNVPNTIDLSPDGKVLYVSSRGRNNPESYHLIGPEWGSIAVIDTATGDYLDAIIGGNQPTGLDVSPDGTMLAYSDFLDHRVTVYSIPPYEELRAGNGGRWEAHLSEIVK